MAQSNTDRENYVPPATGWVREQLDAIDEAGGDTSVVDVQGRPVVIVTMIGARSGRPRRVPLMRVEHDGRYLAVASKGGAPTNPQWTASIRANPDQISVLDGTTEMPMTSRELTGEERATWWRRAVEAFPPYADYEQKAGREIPAFLLEPR